MQQHKFSKRKFFFEQR